MMTLIERAALLSLLPKMKKIDSMQCAKMWYQEFREHKDWHEFASYLDELHTKGLLRIVKPGGFVQYALITAP